MIRTPDAQPAHPTHVEIMLTPAIPPGHSRVDHSFSRAPVLGVDAAVKPRARPGVRA